MHQVTRIARATVGVVGTDDGYLYRWTEPGQAIDVLPQHQPDLLALPGYSAVVVELVDEPVVQPAFAVADPAPRTLVEPPVREDVLINHARLRIEPPVLPDLPAPVDTAVPPRIEQPTPVTVEVTALWSDADRALLDAQGGAG